MPKRLHIFSTSPCAGNTLLSIFYVLWQGLSKILNIYFNDFQWTQASLPVQMGRLGVRSVCMLVPAFFLASAAAMLSLRNIIMPETLYKTEDLVHGHICAVNLEISDAQRWSYWWNQAYPVVLSYTSSKQLQLSSGFVAYLVNLIYASVAQQLIQWH